METLISTEHYRGVSYEIHFAEDAVNPRDLSYYLGKLCTGHKHYDLSNESGINVDGFDDWNEVRDYLVKKEGAVVILPLFMLDQSGLWIRTGNFSDVDHGGWDIGMIGFYYVTRGAILKEYGCKRITSQTMEKVRKVMRAELSEWISYIQGEVYDLHIPLTADWICGFYGVDFDKNGLNETAKDSIDYHLAKTLSDHLSRVKIWIKNRVPLSKRSACPALAEVIQ